MTSRWSATTLLYFLAQEDDYQAYAAYIRDTCLKPIFAEAKIVNNIGDMQHWYAFIAPAEYQQLKERIDLDILLRQS